MSYFNIHNIMGITADVYYDNNVVLKDMMMRSGEFIGDKGIYYFNATCSQLYLSPSFESYSFWDKEYIVKVDGEDTPVFIDNVNIENNSTNMLLADGSHIVLPTWPSNICVEGHFDIDRLNSFKKTEKKAIKDDKVKNIFELLDL
jgi:hypothetical protein